MHVFLLLFISLTLAFFSQNNIFNFLTLLIFLHSVKSETESGKPNANTQESSLKEEKVESEEKALNNSSKTKASHSSKKDKIVSESDSDTNISDHETSSKMAASQASKRHSVPLRDMKNKIKATPQRPNVSNKIVKKPKEALKKKKETQKKVLLNAKKSPQNISPTTQSNKSDNETKSKSKTKPKLQEPMIKSKNSVKTIPKNGSTSKKTTTKNKSKNSGKKEHSSDSDSSSESSSSSSSSSDSSSESSSESSSSSCEDEQMTSQYPIFMVTKSTPKVSNSMNCKQKVFPIKPNPFQRPVPDKKLFKVGVFSRDFYEAHPNDLEILKSVKNMESPSITSSVIPGIPANILEQKSVLPLPGFLLHDSGTRQKRSTSKHAGFMAPLADQTDGFSLRFDIWYQHKYNPFPQIMKSANYKRVRQNVFVDVKPSVSDVNEKCACEIPTKGEAIGCGEKCENRMFEQECRPTTCPTKTACSNQRIQRYEWWPGLQRFMTNERGWGIRTTEPIPEGHFIMEYMGEVCSKQLFEKRMSERYGDDHHHYSLKIDGKMVIDGYRVANEGRFVNHSCAPNCEIQKWAVNGYYRMCLFSTRKIEPGEELCYDYKFDNYGSKQACKCGARKCRGVLGKVNEKNRALDSDHNSAHEDSDENGNPAVVLTKTPQEVQNEEKPRLRRKILSVLSEDDWTTKLNKVTSDITINPNEFVFVHQRLKETPADKDVSISKNKFNFDQELIERLAKTKPLTHHSRMAVAKSRVFLLRNYDHSRSFVASFANSAKTVPKTKDSDLAKPYVKNRRVLNGKYGRIEDSSSESDSGISEKNINKLQSNGVIAQTLNHGQKLMTVCGKIKRFACDKLWTILQGKFSKFWEKFFF